jgi:hypothetical protein
MRRILSWVAVAVLLSSAGAADAPRPPSVLRVLDAETGEALRGVDVVRVDRRHFVFAETPPSDLAPEEFLARSADSPVTIPVADPGPYSDHVLLHVRAEGHAWRMISLHKDGEGSRTVLLARAATLTVRVTGPVRHPDTVLRVDAAEGDRRIAQVPAVDLDSVSFDGLPPGPHRVFAAIPSAHRMLSGRILRLAEAVVDLRAGARVSLTLDLPPPPSLPEVVVSGTLVVPREWGSEIYPAVDMRSDGLGPLVFWSYLTGEEVPTSPPGPQVWRLAPMRVTPGSYLLVVGGFVQQVEIPPGPPVEVRIEVPPPVEVRVRTVDLATGGDAPVEHIFWHPPISDALPGATRDPETDRFLLRLPRGTSIRVESSDDYWTGPVVEVRAGDGPSDATVGLWHTAAVRIAFREGRQPIDPWDLADWFSDPVTATALAGDGIDVARGHRSGGVDLALTRSGRYRLEFPPLDGYFPVEPREVTVLAGTMTRIEVALTPRW